MRKFILSLLLFYVASVSVSFAQKTPSVGSSSSVSQEEISPSYPVVFFKDTIFYIDERQGALTPEERAKGISMKLLKIFDENFYLETDVVISFNESYVDIICGDNIIMSISEADALSKNMSSTELAEIYTEKIKSAFEKARKTRGFLTFIKRIGLVLLVLAGIGLMIFLIKKGYLYVLDKITLHKDKFLRNLSYKGYVFLTAAQELKIVLWLLKAFKWVLVVFLIYMFLPLIFSIFPFSRGWAVTLFGLVWEPFKGLMWSVWNYLPKLFTIVVIYFVFRYLVKFVKYVFEEIEAGKLKIAGFHTDWALPTFSIFRFLLYAFMFVLIFPNLPGSDSDIFKGVSVFVGLLFSLGSSSAIANMVAGFVITYMRPFKIGDRIKIADITGDVVEKTLLVTRIRTVKNEEITIPNSAVLSGNTVNYSVLSKTEGLIIHTTVSIGYDVHWKRVHEALLEAASRTANLIKEKKPFVLQTSLDDFYVSYQLNVYTAESNVLAPIYSELHRHILDVCAEKDIEIMSPHYRAERDGNESTIPKITKEEDGVENKK